VPFTFTLHTDPGKHKSQNTKDTKKKERGHERYALRPKIKTWGGLLTTRQVTRDVQGNWGRLLGEPVPGKTDRWRQ